MNTNLVIDAEIVRLSLLVAIIIFSTISIFATRFSEDTDPRKALPHE